MIRTQDLLTKGATAAREGRALVDRLERSGRFDDTMGRLLVGCLREAADADDAERFNDVLADLYDYADTAGVDLA